MKNLWRSRWINFLTIISISVGLFLVSAYLLITVNADSAINRWSRGFGMIVYLQENIGDDQRDSMKEILLQDREIVGVSYISRTDALETLREVLGARASVIEELDENPLPSSFELKLARNVINPARVAAKAESIRQLHGVEDVQYGEEWLSSLNTLIKVLSIIGLFLGVAIFIAITFTTYTTIKILFYRRIDEIETMKLLGATRSFIKLPFLIEALFIGLFSGILSALLLFALHSFTAVKMIEFLPSMRVLMVHLPIEGYLAIPAAGAVLSLIGSFFATGRIRY